MLVSWRLCCPALAAAASVPLSDAVVRYDGAKIAEVTVKNSIELDALEATGVNILNCVPAVGRLRVVATPAQIGRLRQIGLQLQIRHDDVQGMLDRERAGTATRVADPFADFFLQYHPYTGVGGIVWYMGELVTRYPALTSIVNVGVTLQGRIVWGLRITNDASTNKPGVVYFGCEHAREWISTTIPTYFATHLLQNYGTDPFITDLVDNVEFFLIPVFNVDGYEYTWSTDRLWRKNRRDNGLGSYGVDINRNWGEGWGGPGASATPNSQTYRGTGPFSEPETQALRDFFIAHPNVRAQLDIHSYSQLILWPYGYTDVLPPDQSVYQEVGSAMRSEILSVHGKSYAIGPTYTAIYPASGVSVDWTYAQQGILSYAYECRDTGTFGFELPPDQIIPNNEELLPATLHLTDSDWVRAKIRFEFPNGRPATLAAGMDTGIAVNLIPQFDTALPGSERMHYRYDITGPFLETAMTPLGGGAYLAVLPATNCTSTPEYYFSVQGNGGSTNLHPRAAPATVHSASIITGTVPFYEQALSSDPGWTTEGQWAWGQPAGGGSNNRDPGSGYTGTKVYGYNLAGDYPNNLPATYLTTTAINCTGRAGISLEFRRWLGVESQSNFDEATIEVSADGSHWEIVWRATDAGASISDTTWQLQQVQLPPWADNQPALFIRWGMGPTDLAVTYPGWNIDDVRLFARECLGLPGDYDGNREIDDQDFAAFVACYQESAGGGVSPGCGVFDFAADGDLDCDDWSAFQAAWTAPGMPPGFGPCDGSPLPDGVAKNRYISFTPFDTQGMMQAIRITVTSSELFPNTVGNAQWVGPPDGNGTSFLRCTPYYAVWNTGQLIHAGDRSIVPAAVYSVQATTDGAMFSAPILIPTVALWGDCVGISNGTSWSPPNGVVNFNEVIAAVQAFQRQTTAPPLPWIDVHDAIPNRLTNFADIQLLVMAFQGVPYPYSPPPPCS